MVSRWLDKARFNPLRVLDQLLEWLSVWSNRQQHIHPTVMKRGLLNNYFVHRDFRSVGSVELGMKGAAYR